jgi:hypothetical protein
MNMHIKFFLIFCLVALFAFSGNPVYAEETQAFVWGICGYPNARQGYIHVPVQKQLDLVAELGAEYYRVDWNDRKSFSSADVLINEAKKRGIKILPVLFPPIDLKKSADIKTIYQKSYDYAFKWVSRYKKEISYWELSNEMDVFAMIRKDEKMRKGGTWQLDSPDGDLPEHYEEGRYLAARIMLLGLADGVKAADRNARRIINTAGWFHYGFIKRLIDDRVPFEILGWHWYSDMGDITNVRNVFNVLEQIAGFGKPVWVTEINRSNGSMDEDVEAQAAYISDAADQMRNLDVIKAFFVYELLDEPYLGDENPKSYCGLVELKKHERGHWMPGNEKPAFEAYRKTIERFREDYEE